MYVYVCVSPLCVWMLPTVTLYCIRTFAFVQIDIMCDVCSYICMYVRALYKWPHVACLIILDCSHAVAVAAAACRRLSAIVRSFAWLTFVLNRKYSLAIQKKKKQILQYACEQLQQHMSICHLMRVIHWSLTLCTYAIYLWFT